MQGSATNALRAFHSAHRRVARQEGRRYSTLEPHAEGMSIQRGHLTGSSLELTPADSFLHARTSAFERLSPHCTLPTPSPTRHSSHHNSTPHSIIPLEHSFIRQPITSTLQLSVTIRCTFGQWGPTQHRQQPRCSQATPSCEPNLNRSLPAAYPTSGSDRRAKISRLGVRSRCSRKSAWRAL